MKLALLGGFVDGFDGLKGEFDAYRSDFFPILILAIPDKLGHAMVSYLPAFMKFCMDIGRAPGGVYDALSVAYG